MNGIHSRMILRNFGWLWLMFCMPLSLLAQESVSIHATILDAENQVPVAFAHIGIADTPLGTVSNSEGEFAMNMDRQYLEKQLLVSSVGYVTQSMALDSLVNGTTIIWLEKTIVELDPVVITTLSAKDIVRKAVDRIEQNCPDHAFTTAGFYRTASNENGKFVRLLEAGVKVNDEGFHNKSRNIHYLAVRKSEDFREFKIEEANLLEEALQFDHVKQRKGFLNPENLDFWQYAIVGYTQLNHDHVFQIEARYITTKQNVEHTARIYITDDTYAIVQVEYDYNWYKKHYRQADSLQIADIQWKGTFHYARFGKQYYLNHFTFQNTQEVMDRSEKKLLGTLEVHNEFIAQSVNMFPSENAMALHAQRKDLYAMATSDTLFREAFNVPVATDFYQHILQDLDSLLLQNLR